MIAQANRLDGDGSVEGSYINIHDTSISITAKNRLDLYRERHYITCELHIDIVPEGYSDAGCENHTFTTEEIDPLTLKYSFDGGENFYSESEIQAQLFNTPNSTEIIEQIKERFQIENKNNDLNYKSFSKGFTNGFMWKPKKRGKQR